MIWSNASFKCFKQWQFYAIFVVTSVLVVCLPDSWGSFRAGIGGGIGAFLVSQLVARNCPSCLAKWQSDQIGWSALPDSDK